MTAKVDYSQDRMALRKFIKVLIALAEREERERADSTSGKESESAAETTSPEGKSGVLP